MSERNSTIKIMRGSLGTMINQIEELTDSEYDLYFGPAHPGSGNFSVKLKVDGEKIISARADPGYLHRGFEKLMEYRLPIQNAVLSDRICILEPLNWNLVHAEAVDELMGIEVPSRAKYIRVLMAELSRIQSHIIWYGVFSIGLGFDTGFKMAFGYRDYILDIFELITGGRVYPAGYICPGGVRRDIPKSAQDKILKVLDKINEMIKLEKLENPSLRSRTEGVGVLSINDAIRLGATGPVLRASGMQTDVRKDDPYEIYDELDFEIPVRKEGDAYARYLIGIEEIKESIKIIKQVLSRLPDGDFIDPSFKKPKLSAKIPQGEVYIRNEIARGEAGVYMVSNGGNTPYRCKIRGPSFLHMIPVLEYLLKGAQIADVPAIYWSLNICPADMDR
ncbi:NADH-quinone oxidoreductase subunit D [Thermococci archaeon]|nr:MAG: NADH-quinone oxidoreductase subunit D [Thermoplasmata archaeon]RLF37224.1 MAG: NADH-quinone oxidoreductase subunit D [Thermoplasmata archaeon]RLF95223.1 MAG: NADH-quinone oxidoreductase subunit D [Thermococci archaeon]RLF97243.1 MAG: NADH-quinone oxidoreductase subunit D [Thermococci archaeon]